MAKWIHLYAGPKPLDSLAPLCQNLERVLQTAPHARMAPIRTYWGVRERPQNGFANPCTDSQTGDYLAWDPRGLFGNSQNLRRLQNAHTERLRGDRE